MLQVKSVEGPCELVENLHSATLNISVGLVLSSVHENHTMLSREFCPNDSVARFVIHTSQLLASACITRGVFMYRAALPQELTRVSFLSDLTWSINCLIKRLKKKPNQGHFENASHTGSYFKLRCFHEYDFILFDQSYKLHKGKHIESK